MRNAMRYRVRPTLEQQRAAIKPMQPGERIRAYLIQNTPGHNPEFANWARRDPTPRQLRRMRHKSRMGAVAWHRGERP